MLALLLLPALATPQAAPPPAAPRPPDLKAIVAQIEKGDTAGAERQLRRIVASSGDPAARQLLARLCFDQNRGAEAIVELRKAALAGPLPRDLGLRLATAEIADGHPALAEQQLRSVAQRYKSVQALMELARLQTRQKDAAGSLSTLGKARDLAPNSEAVLSAFAQVALSMWAPVPALQVLEPLARMCPTAAQYQYMLGVALMQVGDIQSSVAPLREADRLEPDRPSTLIALGLVLNTQRTYGDAQDLLPRPRPRARQRGWGGRPRGVGGGARRAGGRGDARPARARPGARPRDGRPRAGDGAYEAGALRGGLRGAREGPRRRPGLAEGALPAVPRLGAPG